MDAVGYMQSPIGWLRFVLNEDRQLVRIDLNVPPPSEIRNVSLFENVFTQFSEYFEGTRRDFTLPLCLNGRAFEMRVWKALLKIPYGEMRSYGEIAAVCGNPKAARAVGQAVHRNPLPIIVPCHRVVGVSNLGGYAGGLAIKRFLLRLEGARKENGEVFLVKNSAGCYSDS